MPPANKTSNNDQRRLFSLLAFEQENGLQAVEITKEEELNDGEASFIVADLTFSRGYTFTMTVPFVHYEGEDWLFTPWDWQGFIPTDPAEIPEITWRVGNTESPGTIIDGLPRLY